MRKLFYLIAALTAITTAYAQDQDGDLNLLPDLYEGDSKLSVKGGLLSIRDRLKSPSNTETESSFGYFLGLAYNFNFSPKFDIQTELTWANSKDGRDAFVFPVLADIALTEDLSLQLGPQFAFLLQEQAPDISGFRIQMAAGLRYDINSFVFVDLRYALQVSNSYIGDGDFTIGANYLTAGVGVVLN